MQHIFNVAIDMDDERIIKAVSEKAEREILKMMCSKVEEIIYQKDYWGGTKSQNLNPLRDMVGKKVEEILKENKDYILNEAAKILADRLLRSKAGKALLEKEEEK